MQQIFPLSTTSPEHAPHHFGKIILFVFLFLMLPLNSHAESTNTTSLINESNRLVQEAISSQANASRFRIDATLFRESLRSLMIAAEKNKTENPASQKLFMQLVRMSALLQSAAACKTGRYIVCPIELRQQLLSQQQHLLQLTSPQS